MSISVAFSICAELVDDVCLCLCLVVCVCKLSYCVLIMLFMLPTVYTRFDLFSFHLHRTIVTEHLHATWFTCYH